MTSETSQRDAEIQTAGNLGFWFIVVLTAVLLIQPFGTTELYDDGHQFLDHVDVLWVIVHFAGAVLFLAILLPIGTWARHLGTEKARAFGRWAVHVASPARRSGYPSHRHRQHHIPGVCRHL